MKGQQLVTKKEQRAYAKYEEIMGALKEDFDGAMEAIMRYWMNLWILYNERLWETAHVFEKQEDWVGSLVAEPFGPQRSQFFEVMKKFDAFQQLGMSAREAAYVVASGKTALIHDIDKLLLKSGDTYSLSDEVKKALKDRNQTFKDFILEQAASTSASAARKTVNDLANIRYVYVHDSKWKDEQTLLAKLVETGGDQRNRVYNVEVILHEVPSELLSNFIGKKFGV